MPSVVSDVVVAAAVVKLKDSSGYFLCQYWVRSCLFMVNISDEGYRRCPLCAEEMLLTEQQLKHCDVGYEIRKQKQCYNNELWFKKRERAVIWNPCVRKCVDIVVPKVLYLPYGYTVVGFEVCPNTSDSKLVKINNLKAHWSDDTDRYYNRWEVEVFSLSSRVWKRVSIDPPLKPCDLSFGQVCIDGFIY
nr:hypothetical protein [Tanacetum cinerariifolium]